MGFFQNYFSWRSTDRHQWHGLVGLVVYVNCEPGTANVKNF
jgi:hypothetical protein